MENTGGGFSLRSQARRFGDLTERSLSGRRGQQSRRTNPGESPLASRLAEAQSCGGESTYPQLQAGQRVALAGHPRGDFNQEYVITAVEHQKTRKSIAIHFVVCRRRSYFVLNKSHRRLSSQEWYPASSSDRQAKRSLWTSTDECGCGFPGESSAKSIRMIPATPDLCESHRLRRVGTSAMWLPDIGDEVLVAFEYGDPRRPGRCRQCLQCEGHAAGGAACE